MSIKSGQEAHTSSSENKDRIWKRSGPEQNRITSRYDDFLIAYAASAAPARRAAVFGFSMTGLEESSISVNCSNQRFQKGDRMGHKFLSILLMFILSFYAIAAQTVISLSHDENGGSVPDVDYSAIEGYADSFPAPTCAPPPKPGSQTFAFTFHRIWGYLTFPEECHPGDTVTHDLIVGVEPGGVHLSFFKLCLSCNTTSGQETLYSEEIEDQDLCETWVLNETINLDIPADANGKVHCVIDTETCTTYHGKVEFETTNIRILTYEELQTAYNNLLGQYDTTLKELEHWKTEYQNLNSSYSDLSDLYSTTFSELQHWKGEYQNLNTTYNNLSGLYNAAVSELQHWKTEYQNLNSSYSDLSGLYNVTFNELQHWKTEYQNLNNTYSSLSGLYNSAVAELQYWKTEYQNLNTTYNSLVNQHNATLSQLNQWISQFNTLNSTYNALLINYSSLNSGYQKLQSDYNALKISYDSLNASYMSLNSSYNSLQENYNSIQSKYNDLLAKYNSLNSTYQQLNLNYTILVQTNQELVYNLSLLQAKYDNLSTSYNLLNSTYYTLLQETENLRTLGRRLWLTIALLVTLVAVTIAVAICAVFLVKKKQN